jgi:tetratricopeptide (TPR) repeat protein
LPKPATNRGFEQFGARDASIRLIAAGGTRAVDPDEYFAKGKSHYDAGRYEEAVAALRESVRLSPNWDAPHSVLAMALTELGCLDEAIEQLNLVVETTSSKDLKILAYYDIGNAYADLGQYERAIESYQQAIKLDATLSKPHNNLGLAYAALGRLAEAVHEFEEAVRLKADYADAHFNLGVAYLQSGKKEEARAEQSILAKLSPELAAKLDALLKM